MPLQEEIDAKVKTILTDGYPMSIGELMNMYRDKELIVNPEFQRFFRWSDDQKSRFIESILLGIPIPSIFVSQRDSGIWDVIDGLQRLSTILEFVGILEKSDEDKPKPSKLKGTNFLPSLEGKMWDNTTDPDNSLTSEQRINFKREKLDIKIIKKSDDIDAKYELFQRLNSGGSKLSDQEIRNCLLIMLDNDFFKWISKLRDFQPFQNCIPLLERLSEEQYDMELVVRFLVYRHANLQDIKGTEDIGDYLTDQILKIIKDRKIDYEQEQKIFEETFEYFDLLLSGDAFQRYNDEKQKFEGGFLIASFEALIVGVSENLKKLKLLDDEYVKNKIKEVHSNVAFKKEKRSRPVRRMEKLVSNSRKFFGELK